MSSVEEAVDCPQCTYEYGEYRFESRTSTVTISCMRCGYHARSELKYDGDNNPCGLRQEINKGAGALGYRAPGQEGSGSMFCNNLLNTAKEVLDAEKWLREALDKGEVDADVAYLTRWNPGTKQAELVIGKFFEDPKTDWDESDGAVAAPMASPRPVEQNALNAADTAEITDEDIPF